MTESGATPAGPVTGAGGAEAALAPLERLAATPVSGHVAVFEEVLSGLEAVLASVEEPASEAER
ncbi:hypothetical protein JOL79_06520 [Microbispora sp. RL4-1S]|uniref:Uncharacterized protein n=1 Tax=Microbispora oryzae TaxID=2806554 RepID=A0A941AGX7_9ACTN|nr:hypothetical protein [Microbispora oryzae]MBP2703450.1 hypothetical protein [Microbispora oryzae]